MSCLSTIDNLKLIFNQSTIQIVSAILSTIAACTSVFFAVKLQKFQKRLITNKLAIDDINELITKLSVARAIHDCPLLYQDSEFEKGIDLSEIPSKIAQLNQHEQISGKIDMSEWMHPIENLPTKISFLYKIRNELL